MAELGSGTSSTLDNRVQGLAFDWNHIFNPGLLNDARVGFNRFKDATLPLDFGSNAGNAVGIPNANHGGNSSGLTKINISGFQQLGDSLWVPETIAENVYQLADTLSWTRGKHSFKFGVDFRRQQRNFFQQTAPSGWIAILSAITQVMGWPMRCLAFRNLRCRITWLEKWIPHATGIYRSLCRTISE